MLIVVNILLVKKINVQKIRMATETTRATSSASLLQKRSQAALQCDMKPEISQNKS